MPLLGTCQAALAAVERVRALFANAPEPYQAGVDLDHAYQLVRMTETVMRRSQSGSMALHYDGFVEGEASRLGEAARTERALARLLARAAAVTVAGSSQLDAIVASTRAVVDAAPRARSAAQQRMNVHALHDQLSRAQSVVGETSRQADNLAGDIRMLGYGTPPLSPGTTPPPPPPLPPPLPPAPSDDTWTHGGDRRWTSVATAGVKQKLVAAAILEMERNGQHNAARMLQHYLDNDGSPQQLDAELVDEWLSDSTNGYGPTDPAVPPAQLVQSNLKSITTQALDEARRTGRTVTVTGNTPWAVVAGSDGDAVRTLGHYSASTAYSLIMNPDGNYTATYRNDISDWYNFASTHPMPWDLAHNISNAAHDLHAAGYAQDFAITGSGHVQTTQGAVP